MICKYGLNLACESHMEVPPLIWCLFAVRLVRSRRRNQAVRVDCISLARSKSTLVFTTLLPNPQIACAQPLPATKPSGQTVPPSRTSRRISRASGVRSGRGSSSSSSQHHAAPSGASSAMHLGGTSVAGCPTRMTRRSGRTFGRACARRGGCRPGRSGRLSPPRSPAERPGTAQ